MCFAEKGQMKFFMSHFFNAAECLRFRGKSLHFLEEREAN